MKSRFPKLILNLPSWIESALAVSSQEFPTIQDRMKLAIMLSQLNVEHKTGGPFGAAIFEQKSGRLISVGVNQVVSTRKVRATQSSFEEHRPGLVSLLVHYASIGSAKNQWTRRACLWRGSTLRHTARSQKTGWDL